MPEHHYRIDLPRTRYSGKDLTHLVTPDSSVAHLRRVERFARYFMREMGTCLQFEVASDVRDSQFFSAEWKAFLFQHGDHFIGAACFRFRPERNAEMPWWFDWLWLHPYRHRHGHLTRAWSMFAKEVGAFNLQTPLSPAMQAFAQRFEWDAELGVFNQPPATQG